VKAMMFIKSDIRTVTIALEKIFYHEVCLELGKEGFIHLSRTHNQISGTMIDEGLKDEEARRREILASIDTVMNALKIEPGEASMPELIRTVEQDMKYVSKAKSTMERVSKLRTKIQEELTATSERISYSQALNQMGIDPSMIKGTSLIKIVFGTVDNSSWKVPTRENFMVVKSGNYVLGAALDPDRSKMMQFIKKYGFNDKTSDLVDTSTENLEHRLDSLKHRLGIIDSYFSRIRESMGPTLMKMHSIYTGYEEILTALRMSVFSSRAIFITGWMDVANRDRLYTILQGICGDKFVAVVSDQRDPDAPVQLKNIKLLQPFELLVKTMGMPANSEIDPTPLTAITFIIMFGLMFGDVGQGLVLALIGLMLSRFSKKRGKSRGGLSQAGGILIICGLSASLCGFLYGSIFSNEHVIPALWFHPMEHIMSLFFITIIIGALFIITGLGINVINNIINSKYTEAFLEKRGLVILVCYSAVVLLAVRYTVTGQSAAFWEAGVFIFIPLVLFCFRGVLGPFLFNSQKPQSISEYVVETFVEILETGLSMLANTVSFIRVGAFALSHAGLSIVTYTLAGIIDPTMKSMGAITTIVIGNIFIIGFEGVVCGIQSMRLEYYEFFSKFFQGDGVAFTPFTLKGKIAGGVG
jgi:V/A-type H+-transporting ATPase subunit I